MFEDQSIDVLPARSVMKGCNRVVNGGNGGRGGGALAVSAAVMFVGGDCDDRTLTGESGEATATGGAGGDGGCSRLTPTGSVAGGAAARCPLPVGRPRSACHVMVGPPPRREPSDPS